MKKYGTTSSAIAFAVENSIQHNMKVLLISTALNDDMIKTSFWQEKKSKSIFGAKNINNNIEKNGIEGLDRIIRSNKITPGEITDYAEIVLKDRLEIILGYDGDEGRYNDIKQRYPQVLNLANKYYDLIVVDLGKSVGGALQSEILNMSDVVVAMIPQRLKEIEKVLNFIQTEGIITEAKTVLTIGKYMEDTKYNAKNITRNVLRKKDLINTIPYNNLFFEASQEGKVIDLFLNLIRTKESDESFKFIQEIKRLYETIDSRIEMLKMNRQL